jgi:hypothetical protein
MILDPHQKPLALLSRRVNHPNAATDNLHPDCRALLILIVAPYWRASTAEPVRLRARI